MFQANSTLLYSLLPRVDDPVAEVESPYYGYTPTPWICILFISLFGISTAVHVVQVLVYRLWFVLPTIVLGGIIEIMGWSGRYWSSQNLFLQTPFMIQITTTIIGPTPILAANFVILGRIIRELGTSYSRLRPRHYTILFVTCDVISLVIQGAGGGIASAAENRDALDLGSNIMLAGIVLQLVIIAMYSTLGVEFLVRYLHNNPFKRPADDTATPRGHLVPRTRLLLSALSLSTVCLLVRGVYRTIELADGWDGKVMITQWYFNVFDAAMVVVAMFVLNFAHPGVLLRNSRREEILAEKITSSSETTV